MTGRACGTKTLYRSPDPSRAARPGPTAPGQLYVHGVESHLLARSPSPRSMESENRRTKDTTTVHEVVAELRYANRRGRLEDVAHEEARKVFYRSVDRRPAAIVQPEDASEVARIVSLAGRGGVELVLRSGGHSLAGHSVSGGRDRARPFGDAGTGDRCPEPHRVGRRRA